MGEKRRRLLAEQKKFGPDPSVSKPFLERLKNSCAITVHAPKTAALIFEKLSAPMSAIESAPTELLTYRIGNRIGSIPATNAGGPSPEQRTVQMQFREGGAVISAATHETMVYALNHKADYVCQQIQAVGFRPVLCYPNFSDDMETFKSGDYGFVVACISGLAIVDEEKLSWEQVMAFREDETSRLHVARFLNWLNIDMNGKSKAQIQDEVCRLYENGQNAYRKFSIPLAYTADALFGLSEERLKNIASIGGVAAAGGAFALDKIVAATMLLSFTVAQGIWFGVRKARAQLSRERDATAFIYGLRGLSTSGPAADTSGPAADTSGPASDRESGWKLYSDDTWTR